MTTSSTEPRKICRTCNICEAMCGMVMTVKDGRITDVRGDPDDVFSRGHICPKGPAMREILEDPDRLRHPLRRTPSGWQRVSWEEALSEAAGRLSAIRAAHGRDAIGVYVGNPSVHSHGMAALLPGFLKAVGSRNRFDANSQDANPRLFACMLMYGDALAIPVPDIDRTDYMLMLGANPSASGGSLMTLGDVRGRLRGVRERGGKLILIDPRRTETAHVCDEHHFIRPGGDAALLLGLLHTLFSDGRIDEARVNAGARGLAGLRALCLQYPPERVSAAVGIPPETIRRLAREFAAAPRAVAYARVGPCQGEFGPVASWLVDALNVVTGNFDRPGGIMFPAPAVDLAGLGRKIVGNSHGRWRSRVRGLPEFSGQLPAAVMAEEMETPGQGQIRAFVTLAGNPVLSVPSGERLAAALGGLEYMVSVDYYLNETTRHAHLILPPLHALERGHYDLVFHALAVRNTVKYSEPVVAPTPGGMDDWQILYELGMRLGGLRFGLPTDRVLRWLWRAGVRPAPEAALDLLLRLGPYGDRYIPGHKGLNLKKVRAAEHGLDLGPLLPARERRVRTRDGLVELCPEVLARDVGRIDGWLERAAQPGLLLIGRRHIRSNNSWLHNVPSLMKGPQRSALLMHGDDARLLGLVDGAEAVVRGTAGAVVVRVEHTQDILRGVVSLPHGFGHEKVADTLRVAGASPGCNVNAVTDADQVEPLLGSAILNGVQVQVEPLLGSAVFNGVQAQAEPAGQPGGP